MRILDAIPTVSLFALTLAGLMGACAVDDPTGEPAGGPPGGTAGGGAGAVCTGGAAALGCAEAPPSGVRGLTASTAMP